MGFKLGCMYRMTVLQFSLLQYRVSTGEIRAPRSSPGSGRGSVHPQHQQFMHRNATPGSANTHIVVHKSLEGKLKDKAVSPQSLVIAWHYAVSWLIIKSYSDKGTQSSEEQRKTLSTTTGQNYTSNTGLLDLQCTAAHENMIFLLEVKMPFLKKNWYQTTRSSKLHFCICPGTVIFKFSALSSG